MPQLLTYHSFSNLSSTYAAFANVTSPTDLIVSYIVLFILPKPAGKANCGYFTTNNSETYQVGSACSLPGGNDSAPVEIPELRDKDVYQFCISTRHAAVLLADGTVYSWGANDYGQLGHGDESQFSRPKKVSGNVSFKHVYCAANATIGLAQNNDVYQWGSLNPGSPEKYNSPHKCGIKSEFVYVGANHAGATKGSKLFMWGLGADGRLGIGSTKDVPCDKPERVRLAVEDVALAARSSALVDETGRVRVFGRNYGHLKKKGSVILTPVVMKKIYEVDTIAGSWTDDFYLANSEDGSQTIFGDQVAIDDPDADKQEPGISKGESPKKMKIPIQF